MPEREETDLFHAGAAYRRSPSTSVGKVWPIWTRRRRRKGRGTSGSKAPQSAIWRGVGPGAAKAPGETGVRFRVKLSREPPVRRRPCFRIQLRPLCARIGHSIDGRGASEADDEARRAFNTNAGPLRAAEGCRRKSLTGARTGQDETRSHCRDAQAFGALEIGRDLAAWRRVPLKRLWAERPDRWPQSALRPRVRGRLPPLGTRRSHFPIRARRRTKIHRFGLPGRRPVAKDHTLARGEILETRSFPSPWQTAD